MFFAGGAVASAGLALYVFPYSKRPRDSGETPRPETPR
jgi:hypothetical protein